MVGEFLGQVPYAQIINENRTTWPSTKILKIL